MSTNIKVGGGMVLGPFYIGVEVLLPGHKGLRAISHSNLGGHVAVQVLEDGGGKSRGKSSWGTISLLLLLLLLLGRRLMRISSSK